MVKIIDVTEEKERAKQQAKLEEKLAKRCFKKNTVYLGDRTILVHSSRSVSRPVMFKATGEPRMTIYDERVLSEAQKFARAYEEQFMIGTDLLGNFEIHSNYSK